MTDSRVVSRPGDPIRPTMFLTLRKACQCRPSTASGPRFVNVRSIWASDPVRFYLKLVRMACDVCDMPWEDSSL